MDNLVSADIKRPRNIKQEARLKQTTIDKMPPPKLPAKLKGTAKPPTVRKPRTVTPKELDISLTVGIPGQDVSNETFDKLAAFIEENARMGMICFERGDAHLLLHIQGMLCIKSSSTRMLKQQIRKAIGWADEGPVGGCICVKSLKDKGLHMIVGIIGYCLKDEKEAHFRMFQKNVAQAQMEEGRRMHWIHGASNGNVKVNSLHDPDMPMLEAENDDNDDPEDNPDDEDHDHRMKNRRDRAARNEEERIRIQAAANALDRAPRNEQERIRIQAAENEDEDCEEIVDVDAYVRAGYQRDEVTRDLLEAGYTVLFREAEADAPQSPQAPVNEHPPAVNDPPPNRSSNVSSIEIMEFSSMQTPHDSRDSIAARKLRLKAAPAHVNRYMTSSTVGESATWLKCHVGKYGATVAPPEL
ncbi:hypothetical protein R1sor_003594 [Riccia sorocarpa]|uniref:Replitron HUH endonuclease domain-containing protein n=1 Tax=Riccia sorocarpa TaxID=122646 RepID=A0ABD3H4T3_9MARC